MLMYIACYYLPNCEWMGGGSDVCSVVNLDMSIGVDLRNYRDRKTFLNASEARKEYNRIVVLGTLGGNMDGVCTG